MSEGCKFCAGEWVKSSGVGEGPIWPMKLNLSAITGTWPSGHGVHLERADDEAYLLFDNSCGEYAEGAVEIKFCPFCGKEIKV